jgi:alkylation response protein AidB-like acyl-CoA dehydrogenase
LNFELDEEQQAILDAVETLLQQHAGPERAIELNAKGGYDAALEGALEEAGFLDVALEEETGFLEAALIVEAVGRAGGVAAIGSAALVAPGAAGRRLPGPIALVRAGESGPVRFGGQARTLLVDAGDEACVLSVDPARAQPLRSNFMLPMARLEFDPNSGDSLGAGSGERLRRFWRLALAVEAAGLMSGALDVTVEYVKQRRQFGRAIGSFQALQHRLALCKLGVEGTRWLAYAAAAAGAPAEKTAAAAAYAAEAAQQLFAETHQMTGAMGFTREHDLHVWSMRLQPLIHELGGVSEHRRAVAHSRWLEADGA